MSATMSGGAAAIAGARGIVGTGAARARARAAPCCHAASSAPRGPAAGLATGRSPARARRGLARHVTYYASGDFPPAAEATIEATLAEPSPLACPICFEPLSPVEGAAAATPGAPPAPLCCRRCRRTFAASSDFVDLTLTSMGDPSTAAAAAGASSGPADATGLPALFASLGFPPLPGSGLDPSLGAAGTQLFRSPLISYVYERGWRQGFAWAGFPGVEKEYELAEAYLSNASPPGQGTLVDMSCGSGLFARRFAASGRWGRVIAADFSENMLRQTREFCTQDAAAAAALASGTLQLVRADVARQPFATGSVAALHAGAALHCWPNPAAALAEAGRVLAPGGTLVGSTFMRPTAAAAELTGLGDEAFRPLNVLADALQAGSARPRPYRFWEEAEIRELCAQAGLVNFRRERAKQFILFAADKPAAQ